MSERAGSEGLFVDRPKRRVMPGYARRLGVLGDVRSITATHVSGTKHKDGLPFYWLRANCELLEFGSLNPENTNYMPGGKPWTAS